MLDLLTPVQYCGRSYVITGRLLCDKPRYDLSNFATHERISNLRPSQFKVVGSPDDTGIALIRIGWPRTTEEAALEAQACAGARAVA